ncbi:universal stress protein UspA [Burkholderia contaminans FFH2055]|uniref:universal stress protein n=1 Tax=Burkholderia contaminans TaxID=488447 RepID=UPI00062539C6|nr:universal stress protein [Burkholderia contaminans]KKL33548.1 universal stress protein UspA [Burkholderia contaminans FFH2055]MEB4629955.1 universal stress protein [Burkholderia contaminans]MEB4636139.1 universal stress protein [Burkholderia contaminans]MEB4650640.1 universal stress protein [Burkholderia contaminans]MEB4660188.1 universal stress protein [Burkholderia contaminans]
MQPAQPIPTLARIALAVDPTPESLSAARYARALLRPGMRLRIVCAIDNPRLVLPDIPRIDALLTSAREDLMREAQAINERIAALFADSGIEVEQAIIDTSVTGGSVADALVSDTSAWQADVLVVGANPHHGLLRLVEGAMSDTLTTRVRCALLIVPAAYARPSDGGLQRLMFAVDGSEPSLHAVRVGLGFATPTTLLYAAYVIDRAVRLTDIVPVRALEDAYRAEGEDALAKVGPLFHATGNPSKRSVIETRPTSDDVAHALMRDAVHWRAELLVVGTHGRRGIAAWLIGSVARRIAHLAQVPVLLVRGTE